MRTRLQGRHPLYLWLRLGIVLLTIGMIIYFMRSGRQLAALVGGGSAPTAATAMAAVPSATADHGVVAANSTAVASTTTATPLPATPTNVPVPTATTTPTTAPTTVPTTTPTTTPTQTPAPTPTATVITRAQLREQLLAASRASRIHTAYPQQVERFVDALLDHLGDFQLPSLGVTEATMQTALQRSDVGDRLNALVQEIWSDWLSIAGRKGFDPYGQEPTYDAHGVSPLRQLTIRLIQGRQGRLVDSQQHALHNFLARSEERSVWLNNIDGVIGAVNRESFQWVYQPE